MNADIIEIQLERTSKQIRLYSIGRNQFYQDVRNNLKPAIIKDGKMSFGLKHEREAISAAKAARASPDDIRILVKDLERIRPALLEAWRERIRKAA